jgi:uncharacterized secreted protein with C-terminal beta-propeller domain
MARRRYPARPLATLAALMATMVALAFAGVVASPAHAKRPRLLAFASCRSLVDYAHAYAARVPGVGVPVRALQGVSPAVARPTGPPPGAVGDMPTTTAAPVAGAPAVDQTTFSGTNVQEAGIDEPDVVKTDGRRVFAVADGTLRVLDVTGAEPRLVGSLALEPGYDHQLLLRGDRLLVLSTRVAVAVAIDVAAPPAAAAIAQRLPGPTETLLTEVDVRDSAAPKVARTMTLAGSYVDARQSGGTIRVVVDTTPSAPAVPLERASLRTFVPATTIRSRISGRTFRRGVVPCDDVRRPDVFSGLDLLTVLTIDLDRGLYSVGRDAIMAGAETVYASDTSLYVASRRYVPGLQDAGDVPAGMRTEIHRFDASHDGITTYAGTGTVPGFVINQFALSELDGALRVASTDEPAWLPEADGPPEPAQSSVTVLRPQGERLTQVGQVSGLGKGQRIYAVRFLGPAGFVVTFRQVDPLYAIDLSRADAPRVAGELELTGYSAYLHPVGDGLLLGVGQEADAQGRPQGTQVSLFDVSDLAHPRRLQHVVLRNGSSDAEFEHHAFLWWPPTGLAVLPLQTYEGSSPFVGAVGLHVTPGALTEVGRVVHGSGQDVAPVSRSLVVGDRLYTLSYLGLQASRLDTLAPAGFAAFPAPAPPRG